MANRQRASLRPQLELWLGLACLPVTVLKKLYKFVNHSNVTTGSRLRSEDSVCLSHNALQYKGGKVEEVPV